MADIKLKNTANTEFSKVTKTRQQIKATYDHSKKGLITNMYLKQKSRSVKRGHSLPTYSKAELAECLTSQPLFHRLFDAWAISNYERNLIPSVDRLDNKKWYTFSNIQLTTWKENDANGTKSLKAGEFTNVTKAVVQLSLDGTAIAEYISISDACRATGSKQGNITKVLLGTRNKTNGFKWAYKGVDNGK